MSKRGGADISLRHFPGGGGKKGIDEGGESSPNGSSSSSTAATLSKLKDCTVVRATGITDRDPSFGVLGFSSTNDSATVRSSRRRSLFEAGDPNALPSPAEPSPKVEEENQEVAAPSNNDISDANNGPQQQQQRKRGLSVSRANSPSAGGKPQAQQQQQSPPSTPMDPIVANRVLSTCTTHIFNNSSASRQTTPLVWAVHYPAGLVQVVDAESRSVWIKSVPRFKPVSGGGASGSSSAPAPRPKIVQSFLEGGQGSAKSYLVAIGYTDGVVEVIKAPMKMDLSQAACSGETLNCVYTIAPPAHLGTVNCILGTPHASGTQILIGYSSGNLLIASPQYRRQTGLMYRTKIHSLVAPPQNTSAADNNFQQSSRAPGRGGLGGGILHLASDSLLHPHIPSGAADVARADGTNPNTPIIFYSALDGGVVKRHLLEVDKSILTSTNMWNAPIESPATQTATIHSLETSVQTDGEVAVWVLWSPLALSQVALALSNSPSRTSFSGSSTPTNPGLASSAIGVPPVPAGTNRPRSQTHAGGLTPLSVKDLSNNLGGGSGTPQANSLAPTPTSAIINSSTGGAAAIATTSPYSRIFKTIKCTIILDKDELVFGLPEVAHKSSRRDSVAAMGASLNLNDGEGKQDRLLDPGPEDAIFTTDKIRCVSLPLDSVQKHNDRELTRWVRESQQNPFLSMNKAIGGVGVNTARLQKVHNTMWVILLSAKSLPSSSSVVGEDQQQQQPMDGAYVFPPPASSSNNNSPTMNGRYEGGPTTVLKKLEERKQKFEAAYFGPTNIHVFEIDGKRELRHSLRFDSQPTLDLEDYLEGVIESPSKEIPSIEVNVPPTQFPQIHEERVMRVWCCGGGGSTTNTKGGELFMADAKCLSPPPGAAPKEKTIPPPPPGTTGSRTVSASTTPRQSFLNASNLPAPGTAGASLNLPQFGGLPTGTSPGAGGDHFETSSMASIATTSYNQAPPAVGKMNESAAQASHTLTGTLEATREEYRSLISELNVTALPMRDKHAVKEANLVNQLRTIVNSQQKILVPDRWAELLRTFTLLQRHNTWRRFVNRVQTERRDSTRFQRHQMLLSRSIHHMRGDRFQSLLNYLNRRKEQRRLIKEVSEAAKTDEWYAELRSRYLFKWNRWSKTRVLQRACTVLTHGTAFTKQKEAFRKWLKLTKAAIRTRELEEANNPILGAMLKSSGNRQSRRFFGMWKSFMALKKKLRSRRQVAETLQRNWLMASQRYAYEAWFAFNRIQQNKKRRAGMADALFRRNLSRHQHTAFLGWEHRVEAIKKKRDLNKMQAKMLENQSLHIIRQKAFVRLGHHRNEVQRERRAKEERDRSAAHAFLAETNDGLIGYYFSQWRRFLQDIQKEKRNKKSKAAQSATMGMLRSSNTKQLQILYYNKWYKFRSMAIRRRHALRALVPVRQVSQLTLLRQYYVTYWKSFVGIVKRRRRFDGTISVLSRSTDEALKKIYYRKFLKWPIFKARRRVQKDRVATWQEREAHKLGKRYLLGYWMTWLVSSNIVRTQEARRATKIAQNQVAVLKKKITYNEDALAKIKSKIGHFEANRHLVGHMVSTTKTTTSSFKEENEESLKVSTKLSDELKKQKIEKAKASKLLKVQRLMLQFGEQSVNDWAAAMGSLEALGEPAPPLMSEAKRAASNSASPDPVPTTKMPNHHQDPEEVESSISQPSASGAGMVPPVIGKGPAVPLTVANLRKLPTGTPAVPNRPPSPVPVSTTRPRAASGNRSTGTNKNITASSGVRAGSRGGDSRATTPVEGGRKATVHPSPIKLRSATPTKPQGTTRTSVAATARPLVDTGARKPPNNSSLSAGASTRPGLDFNHRTLVSDRYWTKTTGTTATTGTSGSGGNPVSSSGGGASAWTSTQGGLTNSAGATTIAAASSSNLILGSASSRSEIARQVEGMTAKQLERDLGHTTSILSPAQYQARLVKLLALLEVRITEGRNHLAKNLMTRLPEEEKQVWNVPSIIYGKGSAQ